MMKREALLTVVHDADELREGGEKQDKECSTEISGDL
jgi:hypothetical protein